MTEGVPALSVVLRVVEGPRGVERIVDALRQQAGAETLEIIAPTSGAVAADLSPSCRAEIELMPIPDEASTAGLPPASAVHERCDIGSTRGLSSARGDIIASVEDTAVPSDVWVRTVLEAHARHPHEAIGGPIDVEADGALAWAAFWLDFGPYVPPKPSGEVGGLSDVNVSYKRAALMSTREVWRASFNEFLVHRAFESRGYRFLMVSDAAVTLRRPRRAVPAVLAERYHWGRVFGAARRSVFPSANTALHVAAAPVLPAVVAGRVVRRTSGHPNHGHRMIGALPALLACGAAWCAGEVSGQLTGKPF